MSGEQEIHNEDTHTSLLSAYGDPGQPDEVPDEQKTKKTVGRKDSVAAEVAFVCTVAMQ